jgi:hypothetical protein
VIIRPVTPRKRRADVGGQRLLSLPCVATAFEAALLEVTSQQR